MNKHSPRTVRADNAASTVPNRRQREKELHRGEILEAAERVFVSRGFDQATMEEIAREAGFSTGAIYNFFQNKDELCLQVLRKLAEDFLAISQDDILSRKDPAEAITALVELRVRHFREHGPFVKMLHETRSSSQLNHEAFHKECGGLIESHLRNLAGLFSRAMEAGAIRKMDPTYAALALEGVLLSFSMHWDRTGESDQGSIEEKVEIIGKNYLDHIFTDRRAAKA